MLHGTGPSTQQEGEGARSGKERDYNNQKEGKENSAPRLALFSCGRTCEVLSSGQVAEKHGVARALAQRGELATPGLDKALQGQTERRWLLNQLQQQQERKQGRRRQKQERRTSSRMRQAIGE